MRTRCRLLLVLSSALLLSLQLLPASPALAQVPQCWPDVNRDGAVDLFDLVTVSATYGASAPLGTSADTNFDGIIDILDLVCVGASLGRLMPAGLPTPQADVVISYVFYQGTEPWYEGDEYAEIRNSGSESVDLAGWVLWAGDDVPWQRLGFPHFIMRPGQVCRVYTNQTHLDTCGFSFGSRYPVWDNEGDVASLYDSAGQLRSQYCYGTKASQCQ